MARQSILAPGGHDAAVISDLSWVLIGGAALIFVFVSALVVRAVTSAPTEVRPTYWVVGGGVIFPFIVLTALLIHGLAVGTAISHQEGARHLRVEVIGKRWWWEVRYESPDGKGQIVLANELHLPTDCTVDLRLTTDNVIHSFWVPALAGKVDMIPGAENRLLIRAQAEGVYRGQCAEYCGDQHALMAIDVVVESPEKFRQWLVRESAPARVPDDETLVRGRDAFLRGGCGTCHTVRGTSANGRLGPDLTHVGSRRSLASGTLPTHVGTLAAWIAGAQTLKPGNLMPSMNVYDGEDLRAVSAYLESLK